MRGGVNIYVNSLMIRDGGKKHMKSYDIYKCIHKLLNIFFEAIKKKYIYIFLNYPSSVPAILSEQRVKRMK